MYKPRYCTYLEEKERTVKVNEVCFALDEVDARYGRMGMCGNDAPWISLSRLLI